MKEVKSITVAELTTIQQDLWGINLHPAHYGTDKFVEFDSMVNIRPRQGNMSRDVEDEALRSKIIQIVNEMVRS